jgi:hypothetical protein
MMTATQVQTYCWQRSSPTAAWTLVHNTITSVPVGNVVTSGFISGPDQVLFMLSRLAPGAAVKYQVATGINSGNYHEGTLADLIMPNKPVLAYDICTYLCCVSGAPIEGLSFIAARACP